MELEIPTEVVEIIKTIETAGYEIYIVGGAVRDILVSRPTYDWDFTTNATPQEVMVLFDDSYYTNDFGMVGIPSDSESLRPKGSPPQRGERPFEITTFRTEHGYSDARRPDEVKWGKTLEEDLERRDFTVNAMAMKVTSSKKEITRDNLSLTTCQVEFIDPFNGQEDLEKKLIRAVGKPDERFKEDALRMMRALRIASELNFKVEEKTKEAIKKDVNLIRKISKERIRDELLKLITSPHAFNAIVTFREVGLMKEILPELEAGFGVEQKSPGRHHIYDVGTHSLMSLKFCPSTDPIVRFATLIHDIGKPVVYKKLPTGVKTFYNHEVVGGKIAKRIANRLRFSNKQKDKLYKLVRYHQFTVNEKQTDSAIRRFIKKVGKELVPDMLDLRIGDRLGGGAAETSWRLEEFKLRLVEVQKQPFTVHDLKITGDDLMRELDMKPGPEVGKILKNLYKEVVSKKIENTKETLLEKIRQSA